MAWLKWHVGTVADQKWRLIAKMAKAKVSEVVAVWASLLERAMETGGSIIGLDPEVIDITLDMKPGKTEAILEAMRQKDMLTEDAPTNWDSRQGRASDSAGGKKEPMSNAERQRQFRERQKAESNGRNASVTERNATVTDRNENVTPCNGSNENVTERNATVTESNDRNALRIDKNRIDKIKNLNTPPLAPQGGPDGGTKNPPPVLPPEDSPDLEPGMEFTELRTDWNEHMRAEGPRAGFKAYLALKKARAWPGLCVIRQDIMRRRQAGVWNPGYEPGLEKYLSERTWEAPLPAPRASPAAGARQGEPAAPTEFQKNMQDRRLMAMMVLERRRAKEKAAQGENDGVIDTQGTGIGIIAGIDADSARLPDRPHAGRTGIAR